MPFVLAAAVALAAPRDAGTVASKPGEICRSDGWCWELPRPQGLSLDAVLALAPDDAWAGGASVGLLHWNGSAWSAVALGADDVDVHSFWAASPTDIWAGGDKLWHWNGRSWTEAPLGVRRLREVRAMWGSSSSDIWAISGGLFSSSEILRWNGSKWRVSNAVPESGLPGSLSSVWGSGPRDVWACGERGLLLHYVGKEWEVVPSPVKVTLTALWGSGAADVWAGGDDGTLIHHDGKAWTVAGQLGTERVVSLWGASAHDVWALSYGLETPFHFDGRTWSPAKAGGAPIFESNRFYCLDGWCGRSLDGLAGSRGDDVWAVGSDGAMSHFDGGTWSNAGAGAGTDVRQIVAAGRKIVCALTGRGAVLCSGGGEWKRIEPQPPVTVSRLWASGAKDLWALAQGRVLRFDGKRWSLVWEAASEEWTTLAGSSADDVWVAGKEGTTLHVTASGVARYELGGEAIAGLAVNGPNDAWLIEQNGPVRHWSGVEWAEVPGPQGTHSFSHLWSSGPSDVWFVAAAGGVFHWDGRRIAPVDCDVRGVGAISGTGPKDVWLFGNDRIARWDGARCTATPMPRGVDTLPSAVVRPDAVFAVAKRRAESGLLRRPR